MKNIKGIIFDKDGTLFHYGTVWGPIGSRMLVNVLEGFPTLTGEEKEELGLNIERKLGVDRYGNNNPDGVLYDNRKLPMAILYVACRAIKFRISPIRLIRAISDGLESLSDNLQEDLKGHDFSEGRETLKALHEKGYRLGIVTSDNSKSTPIFISSMGIGECIDFVRTSDDPGCRKKPHPDAIEQFCSEYGFTSDEVCVVGDTVGDMVFGKKGKAGYRIALLTGMNDPVKLEKHSDVVYESIKDLRKDPVLFPEA